jgi:hypothetical protein
MTEPVKKKYLIELSEANMDLLYTALSEVQDHCGTDEYSNYTTEDYNDLMDSFNNMIGSNDEKL